MEEVDEAFFPIFIFFVFIALSPSLITFLTPL